MKTDIEASRYDRLTLSLHWLTAFLVVEQWVGAHLIDDFAKGSPRVAARSVHITFGIILALVLIVRIVWRATGGQKLPPAGQGLLNVAAKGTHHLLYLLLAAVVVAGITFVAISGLDYFSVVTIPGLDPGNRALRHLIMETHQWLANVILIIAGLHAAVALFHHYVLRDGVLRRMMPD